MRTPGGTRVPSRRQGASPAHCLWRRILPSLSVAVASDGDIVWAEAFGFADVDRRVPVTPLTRFRTGSVSKTLTAAAVAVLYERGRMESRCAGPDLRPRIPAEAVDHHDAPVAGRRRRSSPHPRGQQRQRPPGPLHESRRSGSETFADEPLLFEPGAKYRFSTYGWILLSAVVEGASAEPFSRFMRREVFEPLGMNSTVLEGIEKDCGHRVALLVEDAPWAPTSAFRSAPGVDYSCFAGAGAFLSTPSDLVRLGSAMLKPGLLKAETIALFQTPLRLQSGASAGFALGWKVDSVKLGGAPARLLRHRASLFGGAVSLSVFPNLGLVIAAASNVSQTEHVDPFAQQVAAAFVR